MANVAKLLYSTVTDESYLLNLEADDSLLKQAKTTIRDHLRQAFAGAGDEMFGQPVRPKFFTQGSSAYKTLNDPAWPPGQQKDLDDGCYLPLSFVRGDKPSSAAAAFFEFVDGALEELAEREGWVHKKKPTCSRLIISDDAHVDVPLYAIPDREFQRLQETAAMNKSASMHDQRSRPDTWEALPSDAVLLAHREEDWIESDPRKIHDWFEDSVERFKERLRRDCRYIKGWRDHHELDDHRVTSILLMACVYYAYEDIRGPFLPDREDERLLAVVERLPKYVKGVVPNPACKTEDLNRIPVESRALVVRSLEELAARLRHAIKHAQKEQEAVDAMIEGFGSRIPNRPDLVAVTAAATVLCYPKKVVAAPEVGRSQSG